MLEKEVKICDMTFCPDPEKVYILRIPSLNNNCKEALTEVTGKMGPHAKRYLARRIETDNPQVKKFLASIDLMSQTEKSR